MYLVTDLVDCTLLAPEGERDLAKAIKIDILGCYIQFGVICGGLPACTRRLQAHEVATENEWLI